MKTLVIDNYDSFTYNLVQLLHQVGVQPDVIRNDQFNVEEVANYDKILISPGPGIPKDAGLTKEVIERYGNAKSILGVCLGHQSIAEVFGGEIVVMDKVYHGVATLIKVVDTHDYLFHNIPQELNVGRYHSWLVKKELPPNLSLLAEDKSGAVMAIKHNQYDIRGVQFHPESILTEHGQQLIKNWINN